MAQCQQCQKPAMFVYGDEEFFLCLDCAAKLQQLESQKKAEHERELNYIADGMAATAGIGPIGPRYPPRPQPVLVQGGTFNNIKVTNSTIGVINTGQLQQVDTSISVIGQQGDQQLADAFRTLTDIIIADTGLAKSQKKDAVEILSVLGSEATAPQDQRRSSVAGPIIQRLREILGDAANLATVAPRLLEIIAAAFSA